MTGQLVNYAWLPEGGGSSTAAFGVMGSLLVYVLASVSVAYGTASESEQWGLNAASRKRVENAFAAFSQRHGYNCRPHIKRVEEIKCRGPKNLHLMFQPAMGKPEFVAEFTWVDSADRTHEEFMRHVSTFKSELAAVVGETNVRFEGKT